MSTKWRRNRKHPKWHALGNTDGNVDRSNFKSLRFTNKRSSRNLHPQEYRSPRNFSKRKWNAPKPLIDIFQEKKWITIVAEIAGFKKETLKINVKDRKLTLTAKTKDRRYYKSLNLPKVVIPSVVHTTYKNGVLEIKLKRL